MGRAGVEERGAGEVTMSPARALVLVRLLANEATAELAHKAPGSYCYIDLDREDVQALRVLIRLLEGGT